MCWNIFCACRIGISAQWGRGRRSVLRPRILEEDIFNLVAVILWILPHMVRLLISELGKGSVTLSIR
jgi:hypothetical protein